MSNELNDILCLTPLKSKMSENNFDFGTKVTCEINRDGDLYDIPRPETFPKDYKPVIDENYMSYQERNGLLPKEKMEERKVNREIKKYGHYFGDHYSTFVDQFN